MMKNTCSMPSEVRLPIPPELSNFGLFAAVTSRVPPAICAGNGAGILTSDPSKDRELKLPLPLAVFPTPLILSTRKAPSLSMAIADGNQPVGMEPSSFQVLPFRVATAIALLPPQATYNRLPSGENATASGWLPIALSG